jgi:hypothetical protein
VYLFTLQALVRIMVTMPSEAAISSVFKTEALSVMGKSYGHAR